MKELVKMMPKVFQAVIKDNWFTQLNFFLIIKGLVMHPAPGSSIKAQMLGMFGQLLIKSIPSVDDGPKVAITEILTILLPLYLASHNKTPAKKESVAVQTISELLNNLTLTLK